MEAQWAIVAHPDRNQRILAVVGCPGAAFAVTLVTTGADVFRSDTLGAARAAYMGTVLPTLFTRRAVVLMLFSATFVVTDAAMAASGAVAAAGALRCVHIVLMLAAAITGVAMAALIAGMARTTVHILAGVHFYATSTQETITGDRFFGAVVMIFRRARHGAPL